MPASLHVGPLADGVRTLTLAHPEKKNALDAGVLDALAAALADDAGVRAWLLRATGPGPFSAGYDLTALNGFPEGTPLPDERLGEVLDLLGDHPAPSVALIQGPAIGAGCELAAACDFRVGDDGAHFSMPPARLGIVYALKGLARLTRRMGEQPARRLFLTGRPLDARQAEAVGLLDLRAADAAVQAQGLCHELAALAPLAMAGLKQGFSLLHGADAGQRNAYEQLRRASFNSADAREGKEALLARRPPRFVGR